LSLVKSCQVVSTINARREKRGEKEKKRLGENVFKCSKAVSTINARGARHEGREKKRQKNKKKFKGEFCAVVSTQ